MSKFFSYYLCLSHCQLDEARKLEEHLLIKSNGCLSREAVSPSVVYLCEVSDIARTARRKLFIEGGVKICLIRYSSLI